MGLGSCKSQDSRQTDLLKPRAPGGFPHTLTQLSVRVSSILEPDVLNVSLLISQKG